MDHTLEVLHELVDLRAIARGNDLPLKMWTFRPERRAPVRLGVMLGGVILEVRRGDDAASALRSLKRALENTNVTARAYE